MNCDLWRSRVMELARGSLWGTERNLVSVHVTECPDCGLFLEEQDGTDNRLDGTGGGHRDGASWKGLEFALLAEFERTRAARRRLFQTRRGNGSNRRRVGGLRCVARASAARTIADRRSNENWPP